MVKSSKMRWAGYVTRMWQEGRKEGGEVKYM
jgi:hypothetical protein